MRPGRRAFACKRELRIQAGLRPFGQHALGIWLTRRMEARLQPWAPRPRVRNPGLAEGYTPSAWVVGALLIDRAGIVY